MKSNHRLRGEGFEEGANRICAALKDSDEHYHALRDIVIDNRFLFGGRIQASAGSSKSTTMHNCFVSGTIEDSFVHGEGSITQRFEESMTTMRLGGGIGYDFSTLRPRGANIKKLDSYSSGPVSFMDIFNSGGKCVASSGHRRGAQMGIMRIDHPDIEEFIRAKQTAGALTGFNVSVAVTDEFMMCLADDGYFPLRWGGEVWRYVYAHDLWDLLMRGTWDHAEPGVIFIDQINHMNNLWYCETIAATNPCGEQPLPPFGACLLGSINAVRYLEQAPDGSWRIRLQQIADDMPHIVRAMDNVNDRSHYPLEQQRQEALNKRRMGIGVTGLANALETCGMPYGSPEFVEQETAILNTIARSAYIASADLAAEKGPFPLYDDRLLESGYMKQMDEDIVEYVRARGLRNSHLTSIAPTGSISYGLGDNVSSSIEPVFSFSQNRRLINEDGSERVETISDWGYRVMGTRGKRTSEVTIDEHLAVLAAAQRWTDSAVSKTINIDGDVSWEDFKQVYVRAWELGCKGCTTYRSAGKREGVIKSNDSDEDAEMCMIMPDGSKSCE